MDVMNTIFNTVCPWPDGPAPILIRVPFGVSATVEQTTGIPGVGFLTQEPTLTAHLLTEHGAKTDLVIVRASRALVIHQKALHALTIGGSVMAVQAALSGEKPEPYPLYAVVHDKDYEALESFVGAAPTSTPSPIPEAVLRAADNFEWN